MGGKPFYLGTAPHLDDCLQHISPSDEFRTVMEKHKNQVEILSHGKTARIADAR